MRSGFLNVAPSGSTALSSIAQEKGSRNKRKLRTDQQSPLPLPTPVCNDCDGGSRNAVNALESGNNWTMDCQSQGALSNGDAGVGAPHIDAGSSACCTSDSCNMHQDHVNSAQYVSSGHMRFPDCGIKATDGAIGCQPAPYCKEDQEYEELQEPDWDNYSESQLEEILLNMLDSLYKDAVKKITSCDYVEDEALEAVLRKGRCYGGRDALSSIVENSLAWLKNFEARADNREAAFTDLKEMEIYVLEEMVGVLRKVHPFLSKGDAMWRLLMCDMNVGLACAMEEDAVPSTNKDAQSPGLPSVTSPQSKAVASPSLSPSAATGVPLPQQTSRSPQASIQASGCPMNSHKESRSAFSAPNFSSSPVGKVAVACRQGNSDNLCGSRIMQGPTTLLSAKAGNPNQEQELQTVTSSHQLLSVRTPPSEDQSTKLGLYHSECTNGDQSHGSSHSPASDQLASDEKVPDMLVTSGTDKQTSQSAQLATGGSNVQSFNTPGHSTAEADSLEPDSAVSMLKCGEKIGSTVQLPVDSSDQVQTELQIGNSTRFPGAQSSTREARIDQDASDDASSIASTGTELSLAIASVIDSTSESRIKNGIEEPAVCNASESTPVNQLLGLTDADGEEKKTDMLWRLVDRVKELEAQLQEWTEWAQQKVMQAARRLTKDSVELKALRLEREEYMRLKKEKQSLEESTMKKLSEMETALRKAISQVDRANTTARRLEAENADVRAEMEAAKLTAAESVAVCQDATKREKKSLKKAQGWEKQKVKLQEELAEEKRKLTNLLQQLSQAKERQQQAEVRWRQEKKAKEEALLHAEAEKRAKEQVETAAKRREEALRRKSEIDSQHHRDDVQRLECEIAQMRISSGALQPAMMRWGNSFGVPSYNMDTCNAEGLKHMNARLKSEIADLQGSQRDIHRDRECIMCMSEEMSVVFLPCAHQVVCIKCNDLLEKQGSRDCPACRTPIQHRIRVYGVKS